MTDTDVLRDAEPVAAEHPNRKLIDGLRELADFLEGEPGIDSAGVLVVNLFAQTRDEFTRNARLLGNAEKSVIGNWFSFRKHFGLYVSLELNCSRDLVCAKVKTGEVVLPAEPAKPERVEEVWKYVCPDSVLRGQDGVAKEAL